MATTAPGTRLAAISRAKKSVSRDRPVGEKPTSSGLASGKGAAWAAVKAMPASTAVAMMSFFMGSSQRRIHPGRLFRHFGVRRP
jgi:hypothetical protein